MKHIVRVVIVLAAIAPSVLVHAQTINAWGSLRLAQGAMAGMASGVISGDTTVTLATTRDNSYRASLDHNAAHGPATWTATGEFRFLHVPVGVPVMLTIVYHSSYGSARYTSTYKFSLPAIRFGRRMKVAGYMGDFILHPTAGSIAYTNRYSH